MLFKNKNYKLREGIFDFKIKHSTYSLVMLLLSMGSNNSNELFKTLIIIPITSQILHFYLDVFL